VLVYSLHQVERPSFEDSDSLDSKGDCSPMIDATEPVREYFSREQILPILELSRAQFAGGWRTEYQIADERVIEALRHINESHDYDKIVWRAQQENSQDERFFDPDFLARGVTSLKLYYALEIVDGKNLHSISKTLDPFWHAHQNFSFEYATFCDKAFGANQFLHHMPTDKRDKIIQESVQRRYDYTCTILQKMVTLDDTFWGMDHIICCSYNAPTPEGFIFWRPALIAMEPACTLYADERLNQELRKTTMFVLDGYASLN
jgi:hypothetical protein